MRSVVFFSKKEQSLMEKRRSYDKHRATLLETVAPSKLYKQLDSLAKEANKYHHRSQMAQNRSLDHARRAGDALLAAKKALGIGASREDRKKYGPTKGRWGRWLEEFFDSSAETARVYMRIASHWDDPVVQNARLKGMEPKTMNGFLALVKKPVDDSPAEVRQRESVSKLMALVQGKLENFDPASRHDREKMEYMLARFRDLWDWLDDRVDGFVEAKSTKAFTDRILATLNRKGKRRKQPA